MNSSKRVMLLIDADNVSADVVEQAVDKVQREHGAIHVRRAYCTAESALANLKLFKAHSIRPIVNLSTGKNSTDIALAVDAVDLVIGERPDVVVIVSSDSDFAPLVIKLREKGCRVEGIGQQGKTGEDSKPVYDGFTDIAHRKARTGVAGEAAPVRERASAGRATGRRSPGGTRRRGGAPAPAPAQGATAATATAQPSVMATSAAAPPTAAVPAPQPAATALPAVPAVPVPAPAPPAVVDSPADADNRADEQRAVPEATQTAVPRSRAAATRRRRAATPSDDASPSPSPSPSPSARPPRSAPPTAPTAPDTAAAPATAAPRSPAAAPAAAPMPDDLRRILAVLPELVRGAAMDLGLAAERLRSEELLARNASSARLFRKYPDWFVLSPDRQPNKVQYRRAVTVTTA